MGPLLNAHKSLSSQILNIAPASVPEKKMVDSGGEGGYNPTCVGLRTSKLWSLGSGSERSIRRLRRSQTHPEDQRPFRRLAPNLNRDPRRDSQSEKGSNPGGIPDIFDASLEFSPLKFSLGWSLPQCEITFCGRVTDSQGNDAHFPVSGNIRFYSIIWAIGIKNLTVPFRSVTC